MSHSIDISAIAEGILQAPGVLSADVPVMIRRKGERANDILAALAKKEICVYVLPVFPLSALQGSPTLFYDKAELRIRIQEQPKLNRTSVDAYDLVDEVANALHWQPVRAIDAAVAALMVREECDQATAFAAVLADPAFAPLFAMGALLSHPIQIAARPCEPIEDDQFRIIDVVFTATFQLQ
jgi:hypothetical protein